MDLDLVVSTDSCFQNLVASQAIYMKSHSTMCVHKMNQLIFLRATLQNTNEAIVIPVTLRYKQHGETLEDLWCLLASQENTCILP